ncbi:hypothetical protein [Pontibacter pudoricolor]|uniref:hypothetical protein n=1 Tax=Pontibacter pudoricolor TaxID=2694930 RepID=UPI001391504A|nr:hypothetical protein [Pontibacter pudoricolor]
MGYTFRDRTFIEFLKEQGFSAGMGIMLLFGFLMFSGILALDYQHNRFPVPAFLLLIGMIGLYFFFNGFAYVFYKEGRKVAALPAYSSAILLENVRVYIKNYYPLGKKITLPVNFAKTFYDFDIADILIKENALILLGKGNTFITKEYAAPVELVLNGEPTYFNSAKIESIQTIADGRIEIRFRDYNYSESLNIVLDQHPEIEDWLVKQKLFTT